MAYGSPRQQSGFPGPPGQKPRFSSQLPLPLLRDIFNLGYLIKLTCLQISSATISLR